MKKGLFGLSRPYKRADVFLQSHEWMKHTTNEIDFFKLWSSECDRITEYNKKRGQKDRDNMGKEEMRRRNRLNYSKHRERYVAMARESRKKRKGDEEKMNAYRAWCRNNRSSRRRNDTVYALGVRLRTRIGMAFRNYIIGKRIKSVDLLGCDLDFYKSYIESLWLPGMSWQNYGKLGWHIDHIKPISSFDLSKDCEACAAFNYKNTQPMWSIDNWKKGAKIA